VSARLFPGDLADVLPTFDADSVDACVTDPPYGLKFMGKQWDYDVPSVEAWCAVFRVLKPGAHLVAFGGTRTYHRMVVAIEDAGFEIRDQLAWVYGSGFPKSLDVSKAIDKAAGAAREVVGSQPDRWTNKGSVLNFANDRPQAEVEIVGGPATDAAAAWEGWGTALKPAWEPIVLARKPLAGTVAENVQAFRTGALNIDGCRIEGANDENATLGRWPANFAHDGSDEVVALFPDEAGAAAPVHKRGTDKFCLAYGKFPGNVDEKGSTFQGDSGSAARFFYCAKASREDREDGLAHLSKRPMLWSSGESNPGSFQSEGTDRSARNNHPTVKPTDLMRWLCRLVTPPGGLVLDPFMGSGSTGRAAFAENFRFVGIERDPQWLPIAEARIRAISPLFAEVQIA
jgi:site-specific DNA-methyltransferase (adenine-specific)